MFRTPYPLLACALLAVLGCSKKPDQVANSASQTPTPNAAVKLNVLVIDDQKIAAGINLLRGEWSERSGGEMVLTEMSTDELLATEQLKADIVIYPSRFVGTLVDRKWLRPIRDTLLTDSKFGFGDLLPLIRNRSIRYGNKIYSLSLGSPPLMISCPADLLPKGGLGRWENLKFTLPVRTPQLKFRWATELLVRGVSSTQLKSDAAVLFDPRSMEPRIESPPFVKALDEIFSICRDENLSGNNNPLGLAWPTSHLDGENSKGAATVKFFSLPKAKQVYRPSRETWEANDATESLTMLGFAGRSVSVLRASRNSASAFKLLVWLTSGEAAIQLSQRSDATIWFRTSQVSQSQKWLAEKNVREGTAAEVTALLSAKNCFLLPRIPGIDDYLKTLDLQIEQAAATDKPAAIVLAAVAEKWRAITERRGTQRQRAAYRQHLGFSDLAD